MTIVRYVLRRNTTADWIRLNPILLEGEPGYDIDAKKFRIGDGTTRWLELPDYLPESEMLVAIADAVTAAIESGAGGEAAQQALLDHIISETPHPVYDDGPSLQLLYYNSKV